MSYYYRITPAHAGKGNDVSHTLTITEDHPRACGERHGPRKKGLHSIGSPPRMRGKVFGYMRDGMGIRITPAHAGKGFKWHDLDTDEDGSPPRMRGKAREALYRGDKNRITPAHAGKGGSIFFDSSELKDHPRACGERDFMEEQTLDELGSPPRMRGKGRTNHRQRAEKRITPAHAGKGVPQALILVQLGDHPRACGERFNRIAKPFREQGSPPRMRGKVQESKDSDFFVGITPAHAGKGEVLFHKCKVEWDHPRACGERALLMMGIILQLGSPPRMRGKV